MKSVLVGRLTHLKPGAKKMVDKITPEGMPALGVIEAKATN